MTFRYAEKMRVDQECRGEPIFIDVFEIIENLHTHTFIIFSWKFIIGSGFPGTPNLVWLPNSQEQGTRRGPGYRVLPFLGTANPLEFLAPDVLKPGFGVPMNPEHTLEFAFQGTGSRTQSPARVQLFAPETEPAIFLCPNPTRPDQNAPGSESDPDSYTRTRTDPVNFTRHPGPGRVGCRVPDRFAGHQPNLTPLDLIYLFKIQGSGFYPSSQPQLSNDLLENVQVHKMILELSALLNVRQLFLEGPLISGESSVSHQQ